jgi:hypothetical protein
VRELGSGSKGQPLLMLLASRRRTTTSLRPGIPDEPLGLQASFGRKRTVRRP